MTLDQPNAADGPNPSGLCQCGCGLKAPIAPRSLARRGYVRGKPYRYIFGHQGRGRKKPNRIALEDRGYDTPCWIWQLATITGRPSARTPTPPKYGTCQSTLQKKQTTAHRVYYEDRHGPIPDELEIDHLCRVTLCVNPDHLEAVTHLENQRRGSNARLTMEKAAEIRRAADAGASLREMAERFGISETTASYIRARKVWVP